MLRKVLVPLALLIAAVFAFVGYNTYSTHQPDPGAVTTAEPRSEPQSTPFPVTAAPAGPAAETTPEVTSGGSPTTNGVAAPSTDSIAADPPNGMTFGGSGHYQLYRQGDLTWRLNTDTGETCVLFATDDEWRKPKVYRAGCRGRS